MLIDKDMTIKYYDKLKQVDERLEEISKWREQKLDKVLKKRQKQMDRIILKSGKLAAKAMKELGMTIPTQVKEKNNGSE